MLQNLYKMLPNVAKRLKKLHKKTQDAGRKAEFRALGWWNLGVDGGASQACTERLTWP